MILQKLILHPDSEKTVKLVYNKRENVESVQGKLILHPGSVVDFSSYFNLFSAEKWKKYTTVSHVGCELTIEGSVQLRIQQYEIKKDKLEVTDLLTEAFCTDKRSTVSSKMIEIPNTGMIGICVQTEKGAALYSGAFVTNDRLEVQDVKIGIGICTFRREAYVERNMKVLQEQILENPDALAYGHISVCISDNAGTLKKETLETSQIRIVKNKNLGGVGGFTRTMIEHIEKDQEVTHVLLMDDDAVISPEAIERNYTILTLLKKEYRDYVVGGALLREDQPLVQYENGARWNDGDIEAIHHDLRLDKLENVILNSKEEHTEYSGWWYSCIPVAFIKKQEFPLPFFIHRDDVEYGLRAEGRFLLWNGICVWHAAFENKLPGIMEYYDMRNLAITNAIHNPAYGAREYKKMLFIQVSSNIGKYRYRYVDLNLNGALDFLKGFQWFYKLDTLQYHKELAKYNYDAVPAESFEGYRNIQKEELNPCEVAEEAKPGRIVRMWRMVTMNGHFFPCKTRIKVARPNPNIYELYRCKEVIYAESAGNAILVKRSAGELVKAYMKLLKVFRLIDKHYEHAKRDYQTNYQKLITEEFWKKYLEIQQKGKENGN